MLLHYLVKIENQKKNVTDFHITHTTLFTKAWQIQNIDISVRKENKYIYIYIYTNKKITSPQQTVDMFLRTL